MPYQVIEKNILWLVLGPFYPNVNLKSCPVFNTPAPTVVHVHQKDDEFVDPEPESEPEYEPVVGSAPQTTVPALLMVAAVLRLTLWSQINNIMKRTGPVAGGGLCECTMYRMWKGIWTQEVSAKTYKVSTQDLQDREASTGSEKWKARQ